MSEQDTKDNKLLDRQVALSAYFDDLLGGDDEPMELPTAAPVEAPKAAPAAPVSEVTTQPLESDSPAIETPPRDTARPEIARPEPTAPAPTGERVVAAPRPAAETLLKEASPLGAVVTRLPVTPPPLQAEPEPEPQPEPVAKAPPAAPVAEPEPEVVVRAPEPAVITPEPVVVAEPEPAPAPAQPAVPEWAAESFQSLLFQVAGLTLAVPLAKLNGVTPWDLEQVTEMPGHSRLFLGLYPHHGTNAKVADTAQVVLPPDRLAQLNGDPAERISHLVVIGEGQWGLACSAIGEVVSLGPKDVKWRSASGKRPWLAGTVIHHMCALLDVDALITLLNEGTPDAA